MIMYQKFQKDLFARLRAMVVTSLVCVLVHVGITIGLEVHSLKVTDQKAFVLGQEVPCRVGFHSIASAPRVHARGWG